MTQHESSASCGRVSELLADELDGLLEPGDENLLRAHLAGCLSCERERQDLQALHASVKALPAAIDPERDLWPGVVARLDGRAGATESTRRGGFAMSLAAAAALVLLLASMLFVERAPIVPASNSALLLAEIRDAEDEYRAAAANLTAVLARNESRLPASTGEVIKANLAIIDAAIVATRVELERGPDEPRYARILGGMFMQRAELVRRANAIAVQ